MYVYIYVRVWLIQNSKKKVCQFLMMEEARKTWRKTKQNSVWCDNVVILVLVGIEQCSSLSWAQPRSCRKEKGIFEYGFEGTTEKEKGRPCRSFSSSSSTKWQPICHIERTRKRPKRKTLKSNTQSLEGAFQTKSQTTTTWAVEFFCNMNSYLVFM